MPIELKNSMDLKFNLRNPNFLHSAHIERKLFSFYFNVHFIAIWALKSSYIYLPMPGCSPTGNRTISDEVEKTVSHFT